MLSVLFVQCCTLVPASVRTVVLSRSAAMNSSDTIHDLVFRFAAFRRHSFFFYNEFDLEYLVPQQFDEIDHPSVRLTPESQFQIDQLARDIRERLRLHCRAMTVRADIFEYVAHRPYVRPGQVIVQLDYISPAIPHLTELASVSRLWLFSVSSVTRRHNMVDYRRLQLESQRRDMVFYWVHASGHDRFTLHADLIPEMRLLLIRSPV